MANANSGADFDRGRRVGKYEILTRLSMGGMAELSLAFLPGPGGFKKFVALKQILPDVRADESFVKMFLDEARITAAFNHPNIAQVFELGQEENHELYLAMEFVSGQNLAQVIKRASKREVPIPIGFACRVIRDAALGLHYAHHFTDPTTGQPMAVVHRDVSPKNVMITYAGQVKMIDFGIAKARGRLNRTQIGIVKGTSGYMSPEQVRNETLDGRTDLFAAAVMLHEMLAGERLFTAPTDAAMMVKIVDGEAPSPAQTNPYVTPELAALVLKGLSKNRDQRFATGKELARAIERVCPDLFDDEQLAATMTQLFDDKIALTRAVFELANEERADKASMTKAVQGLTTDEQDGTPRPKSPGGAEGPPRRTSDPPARVTPGGRPGLATPKSGHSQRSLPKVAPRSSSNKNLPPVPGRSQRGLPKVQESRRSLPPVTDDAASKRAGEDTVPPVRRRQSGPQLPAQPDGESTTPGTAKGGGLMPVVGVIAALLVLGGLGWAVTLGPFSGKAKELVQEEHPATTPQDPKASAKPAWLVAKELQEAQLAAERERQRAIEEAANDPERQKLLDDIQAQLAQLNKLEEEQRQLKLDARASKTDTEANSKKIGDLQKQIDDLKGALETRRAKKKAEDGVEVVRDARSAKNADVGFVTLRTVNPSSAAVFDGNGSLGSTPLVKLPLEVGTHTLKVVDADSKARVLSVKIEAGKTLDLKGLDVTTLPLAQ